MATAFKQPEPAFVVRSADDLPDLYAMNGKGNCMSPLYEDGVCLAFSKTAPVRAGDTVIVWFKPEHKRGEYQCLFKRLVSLPPVEFLDRLSKAVDPDALGDVEPLVILEMLNPPKRLAFPFSHILAMHRCIGEAESQADGRAKVRHDLIEEAAR